jgi:hypothetical protein
MGLKKVAGTTLCNFILYLSLSLFKPYTFLLISIFQFSSSYSPQSLFIFLKATPQRPCSPPFHSPQLVHRGFDKVLVVRYNQHPAFEQSQTLEFIISSMGDFGVG